ncbi:MAG: response regulator transcription factor [Caulobacteraceae bacterium]|nr:response regulator transcription factor [Caulobacteraceae bacterium]
MARANLAESIQSVQRVLVVEDDPDTLGYIADGLEQNGWRVATADDGDSGLLQATDQAFDVIVVDRLLPKLDGLSLVRRLRERRVQTPVIFLTALGAIADRVSGLDGGGDDYLVKPFSLVELNARVSALARRPALGAAERTVLEVEDVVLDRLTRTVRRAGAPVDLLPMEYRLLEFLMLHRGRPVTRTMLLEQVWGFDFDPRTNIVETHISRLRGKITPPGASPLITTLRGAGYVIGGTARPHA